MLNLAHLPSTPCKQKRLATTTVATLSATLMASAILAVVLPMTPAQAQIKIESAAPRAAQGAGRSTPLPAPEDAPKTAFGPATAADWSGVYIRYRGPLVPNQEAGTPSYTPEYQAKFKAYQAQRAAGEEGETVTECRPPGMPRQMSLTYPMEVVFRPKIINIIFEWEGVRRVFMDGRKFPDYVEPTYRGTSIGRWEGNTLVIETTGITTKNLLSTAWGEHSEDLKVTERIRGVAPGVLENRITLEDKKALAKPFEYTLGYVLSPGEDVNEYYCEYNREAEFFKK